MEVVKAMEHELLSKEMAKEHGKWAFSTKVYGTLYPTIRFYLIVASALVAAKDSLTSSSHAFSAGVAAVLAVSVARSNRSRPLRLDRA